MTTAKFTFSLLFILGALLSHAQFQSSDDGVYMKIGMGNSRSFQASKMTFDDHNGRPIDLVLLPGGGINLCLGAGIQTKKIDYEFNVMPNMIIGYSTTASTSSQGSSTNSNMISLTKFYFIGNVLYKISLKKEWNYFRIGGGMHLVSPSKLDIKVDGTSIGTATYNKAGGAQIILDWVIQLKSIHINPGVHTLISNLKSNEITFLENEDKLDQLNISGINFFIGIIF